MVDLSAIVMIPREADWPERNVYQEAEGGMSVQHHLEGVRNIHPMCPFHFIHSILLPSLETSLPQETEGAKPKKGGKTKKGKNVRQHQSSQQGDYKVCSIEGTRASIDKCLDIVKQK